MDAIAVLSRLIRDASGQIHRPGEAVQVIRSIDQLGKPMLMIQYLGGSRGIVSPEEIQQ